MTIDQGPVVNLTAPNTTTTFTASVPGDAVGISFQWCKESGLGEVTFGNATEQTTGASFDIATLGAPDVYLITVVAARGNRSAQDSVMVVVGLNPAGDFQPGAILNLVNDTAPATHSSDFLTYGIPSNVTDANTAAAYYKAIDPFDKKTNFGDWLTANGMLGINGKLLGDVTVASYFNAVDLGFGRRMLMSQNRRAFSVSNYDTVDDAVNERDPIAAVTMEYAPPDQDPSAAPFTKFYIFKFRGGSNGARDLSADLDGGGEKYLPGLCIVCHGGRNPANVPAGQPYPDGGNVHAHFLPFDLNALDYSCEPKFTRSAQEGLFHKLNQGILGIEAGTDTSPPNRDANGQLMTTLITLIEGWYGADFVVPAPTDLPNHTQDSDFVPTGWAARPELYSSVVARSCRNCHSTRPAGPFAFGTSADFDAFAFSIKSRVFDNNVLANIPDLTTLQKPVNIMPHARKTFQRFWQSTTPAQPEILRDYLQSLGVP